MAGEIVRRTPTSAEIGLIAKDYEPVRVAGIWERCTPQLLRQAFPFLALSQSRAHVPLKSMPLFRFDAGVVSEASVFPMPAELKGDQYTELAEMGLVQVVGGRLRKRQIQVWMQRRIDRLRFHPPITEALGTFLTEYGVEWDPASLKETDINQDFLTLCAPVPRQEVTMELGGPARTIAASALVAAGLRLAMCETLALQDFRDYQAQNPELFSRIQE